MAKKIISRKRYQCYNIIFHALCLSGLIWQITQISINFFHFDVIRDIKVRMPEEINDANTVIYICFENENVIDTIMYKRYFPLPGIMVTADQKKGIQRKIHGMNVSMRLNVSYIGSRFFKGFNKSEVFVLGLNLCYRITNPDDLYAKRGRIIGELKPFGLCRGQPLPLFDHRRLVIPDGISMINQEHKGSISYQTNIKYSIYSFSRKLWPYTDNCKDYTDPTVKNRLQSIESCVNRKQLTQSKYLSPNKIVRSKSKYIGNVTSTLVNDSVTEWCESSNIQLDCNQEVYFTVSSPLKYTPKGHEAGIRFEVVDGSDPSVFIKSKPRIDNIDYLTYILGTLGAWIGFSFTAINPLPFLFNVKESKQTILTATEKLFRKNLIDLKTKIIRQDQMNNELTDTMDTMKNGLQKVITAQQRQSVVNEIILRELSEIKNH